MTRLLTAPLAAVLLIWTTGTFAQGLEQWGTAGGWDIMVDKTLDSGCFIQAEYDNGSLVRIGIDKSKGVGYVTAFNEAWGDIEEGITYPIEFDLDGERFEGEAIGLVLDGVPGADIHFDNEDFFWSIMKKYVMTIYNQNGEVMAISLDGTFVGLEGVLQCQEEIDASR